MKRHVGFVVLATMAGVALAAVCWVMGGNSNQALRRCQFGSGGGRHKATIGTAYIKEAPPKAVTTYPEGRRDER